MILIPEKILKIVLDYAIDNITEDYLKEIFGDQCLNGYNYLENAKAIFLKEVASPRRIESHLFFNRDRVQLPTIHIGMPNEYIGEGNGIGFDPGEEDSGDVYIDTSSRTFNSKYNIVFTSNNTFETLIMYNVIKSVLIGNVFLLESNGLTNVKFSGGDILLNDYLVPVEVYSRALYIECIYDFVAPKLTASEKVRDVKLTSILE